MNGKDLEKVLLWEAPHIGEKAPEQIPEAQDFCEGYKTFLNEGKTERECVKKAVILLENAGYQKFDPKASYKAGDKIYWNNRKKALYKRDTFAHCGGKLLQLPAAYRCIL